MRRNPAVLAVLMLGAGLPAGGLAQGAPQVLLTETQATCLARQADAYIAKARPVYVVVIPPENDCPNPPAGTQTLASESTASGAGIGLKEGDSSGFIVMTQEQLTCLKTRLTQVLVPDASGKFRLALEKCAG